MPVAKTVERSVDTLQRVYAVIVALAISEGIKRTFLKSGSGQVEIHYQHLAEFIALIATAVPFLHGMNRHLDQTLSIIGDTNKRSRFLFIVLDFVVFLVEGCFLFLLAALVTEGVKFFKWLMGLLVLDVAWAFGTWRVTKSAAIHWAWINGAMFGISAILLFCFSDQFDGVKTWVLAIFAVARTVLDYWWAWAFYFPPEVVKAEGGGGVAVADGGPSVPNGS
jgi:hypothetical protein